MARILVPGSGGLLGCSLVPFLRSRGHIVIGHSRKEKNSSAVDLSDPTSTGRLLAEVKPDVIINLAALTNVDECERDPKAAYRTNVRIVENLAAWIRKNGSCCHLVQLSTDQLYDGKGPHQESTVSPSNYYAFSKYAAELAALTVPATVLRTNFFGPSQCSGRQSITDWLIQSLSGLKEITVFEDVCFTPLSLQRLVGFIDLVLGKCPEGIFNLGSRRGMSKAEFAFTFADMLELPTKSVKTGSSEQAKLAAYRPKDMRMDPSRVEDVLGIEMPALIDEIKSVKAAYDQAR